MIKQVYCSSLKVPLGLFDFNETSIFSTGFQKLLKYQIFTKIRPVGATFVHTDRRTDMKNLIVAFRKFGKASKKSSNLLLFYHCVAEICLCVLQTSVASLQSPYGGRIVILSG